MKNIPNILSSVRIALVPFFIWQMICRNTVAAGVILLVSSLTDLLDGMIARKFNWVSRLGKLLDPIADKLTQSTVSLALIITLREYWYLFAFMIFKDAVILTLGGILLKKGMRFKGPRFLGKVSTFFFYTGMLIIILFPKLPEIFILFILIIAAVLALVSGLLYIPEYYAYKLEISKNTAIN